MQNKEETSEKTNEGTQIISVKEESKESKEESKEESKRESKRELAEIPLQFGAEIKKLISTAGTLALTNEEKEILYASVKDEEVFIKPDGLIYLQWKYYSQRLNKSVGGTGWAMIPEGMPKMAENIMLWGFHLVIRGVYCGFAIGEQEVYQSRGGMRSMTFGEQCEGAKSNALMRLCKGIGIGLELWDKNFIDRWVATHAKFEWADDGRGGRKKKWSLKDGAFKKTEPGCARKGERVGGADE